MGTLESLQPEWALMLNAGLRFALFTLAAIAIATGAKEIWCRMREVEGKRKYFTTQTYAIFYVNRVLIGLSIVLATPSVMYRYDGAMFAGSEQFIFNMQMLAHLCMIWYFLMSETLRLMFSGLYTLRRAIRQSWSFVAAAFLLGAIGTGLSMG